jgi:hypothetical protein
MKRLFQIFTFIVNVAFFVIIASLLISDIPDNNYLGLVFLVFGLSIVITVLFFMNQYNPYLKRKRLQYRSTLNALKKSIAVQECILKTKVEQREKLIASLDDEIRCKTEEYSKLKEKVNEINSIYKADEKNLINYLQNLDIIRRPEGQKPYTEQLKQF